MLITNVRAHHLRIPYDAGPASFKQGASAISAIDIALIEVSTDAGLTGWGDGFGYVCPRTVATAIDEMVAPQARGLEVPDAAGHSRLHGSHPAQSASVRPLWRHDVCDLRARYRAVGSRRQGEGRAAASPARRPKARADSGLCKSASHRRPVPLVEKNARPRCGSATGKSSCMRPPCRRWPRRAKRSARTSR